MRLNPFPCGSFLRPHLPHHFPPVADLDVNRRTHPQELAQHTGPTPLGSVLTPVWCERCDEWWLESGIVSET